MHEIKIGRIKKVHVKGMLKSTYYPIDKKVFLPFTIKSFIPLYVGYICIGIGLLLGTVNMSLLNELNISVSASSEPPLYTKARVLGLQDQSALIKSNDFEVSSQANNIDKRIYVLDEYFKMRNSPLYGYAKTFVEACDRYGAPKDCLVVPAIARHETDLCKYYMSAEMKNCMGWGGGGEYRMTFNSFEEHINIAYDVLVNQYGLEFMRDPSLMDDTFCGPEAGCKGWGYRVKVLEQEIDDFGVSLGVGRLSELDKE